MKPCAQHRKALGWLATGALSESEATFIRAHLEQCAGCRAYARQFEELCDSLSTVAHSAPEIPTTGALADRVVDRIRHAHAQSPAPPLGALFRGWFFTWRGAALAAGVGLIVLVAVLRPSDPAVGPASDTAAIPPVAASPAAEPLPAAQQPTYAAYRHAASVSLEQLDALLAKENTPRTAAPSGSLLFTAMDARSVAAETRRVEGL